MSIQSVRDEQTTSASSRELCRPEETFWQHYSPHHEFPVATVSAITLCGLVMGLLVLWWVLGLNFNNDADAPPSTDAVTIEGPPGGGGGSDGLGNGDAPLASVKTELGQNETKDKSPTRRQVETAVPLPDDLKANPLTPANPLKFTPPSEDVNPFANLEKEASKIELDDKIAEERARARKAMQSKVTGNGGLPGGKNSAGGGGGTGGGYGTGDGPRTGPGVGKLSGRVPTKQEIRANRWKISLSGDIEQHVRTLIAMGVNYTFVDANNKFYKVRDLRRTPVELTLIKPINAKEVVAWDNRSVPLLRGLTQRLKLPFWPTLGVITLPADVEEKIAAVEHEALEKQGRSEQTTQLTHIGVRLGNNGGFEPYVIGFE